MFFIYISLIALVVAVVGNVGAHLVARCMFFSSHLAQTPFIIRNIVDLILGCITIFFVAGVASYLANGLNWFVGGETSLQQYCKATVFLAQFGLLVLVLRICLGILGGKVSKQGNNKA